MLTPLIAQEGRLDTLYNSTGGAAWSCGVLL